MLDYLNLIAKLAIAAINACRVILPSIHHDIVYDLLIFKDTVPKQYTRVI